MSTKITFKNNSYSYFYQYLDKSEFCTDYKNKYFKNTINIVSDVAYFKNNFENFQDKIFISKIFLIIVLVLSCISVLNSSCTIYLYDCSFSGDYEHEWKHCCFGITGIKFTFFLPFGILYLCFFIVGEIIFKKEFFNDFMEFFKSCNIAAVNNVLFEEINNYIGKSLLLGVIGFSIKIVINIIFLSYELHRIKKEKEELLE